MRRWSLVFFLLACCYANAEDVRDGNWWRNLERHDQLTLITGFFDGMELGHLFSFMAIPEKDAKNTPVEGIAESYETLVKQLVSRVTNGQLAAGLNDFYADERNRNILIYNAVWLVTMQIAGKPEHEMKPLIQEFRKASPQPQAMRSKDSRDFIK